MVSGLPKLPRAALDGRISLALADHATTGIHSILHRMFSTQTPRAWNSKAGVHPSARRLVLLRWTH
jgi:hypothetical protein